MKYTILLNKEKECGYSVQCLEIPGAISQGETKEEALKNIKEVIEMVFEVMKEESHSLGKSSELIKICL
ncbi:MAG: type II toxin-antitoxin system HicB family antitoxin [Candidatus Aenigmatarchaeota archaeon]